MGDYPKLGGEYTLRGTYRLAVSTGAVTVIAARTATAGHLFAFRWSSSSTTLCRLRYVGAKFILTTAYGTAQETGIDMIVARSYTASHTGATAVDNGSTVADTGKALKHFDTSLAGVAGLCRVADTGALTAGTHTFDANPFSIMSGWSGAIGDTVPMASSLGGNRMGALYDARPPTGPANPLYFKQDEGFVLRNLILMGAIGVGRWDFQVEWDEVTPV